MRILAFDTSTVVASVAVTSNGNPLAQVDERVEAKHGETLLPRIDAALQEAGLKLGQIDLIGVGLGPGSFTGVRVGLATAKGLVLATGMPLVGVASLRTLCRAVARPGQLTAAVVDAYRAEVYVAAYAMGPGGALRQRLGPLNLPPQEAARALHGTAQGDVVCICGDGARRYWERFSELFGDSLRLAEPSFDVPGAVHLACEAEALFRRNGPSDLASLEPLYLRPSDAKLPREPLRVPGE